MEMPYFPKAEAVKGEMKTYRVLQEELGEDWKIQLTIPSGKRAKVHSVECAYVASAVAGNRGVALMFIDPTNTFKMLELLCHPPITVNMISDISTGYETNTNAPSGTTERGWGHVYGIELIEGCIVRVEELYHLVASKTDKAILNVYVEEFDM